MHRLQVNDVSASTVLPFNPLLLVQLLDLLSLKSVAVFFPSVVMTLS